MITSKSLVLVAALGLAAGCGGNTTPNQNTPPPTGPSITIQGFAYSPAAITVNAGDSITVTNLDSQPHTATSEAKLGDFKTGAIAGVSFDTGNLAQNQTTTITIPASAPSGTVIPYYCVVHGSMMPEGTVTVR